MVDSSRNQPDPIESIQLNQQLQLFRRSEPFVTAMKQGTPISLKGFTDDLSHRLHGVQRDVEGVDTQETNNKLATYQALFALPFDHNVCNPIRLPGYLYLNLSQHVMQSVSRFRLRTHTLNVETAPWEDGILQCAIDAYAGEFKMRSISSSCVGTRGYVL
eukprot:1160530-Pelagomonas_calceolata.AAC.1